MKLNKGFYFLLTLGITLFSLKAQDKEAIKTQEVLVIKSYTPSLSDAFKISEGPQIPDSLKAKLKILNYKIKPVSVVSTFEPNKAKPMKLQRRLYSSPFNTFFSGGFGSMSQVYFNFSSVIELDRSQRFGLNFYRDGFGGDVGNSLLKSSQGFSQYGANHNLRSSNYNVNTQLQFTTQKNNYFGLYETKWDNFLIASIDPEIKRNYFKFRTYWDWFDSVVRSMSFQVNITGDNFTTTEQQFALESNFSLPLVDGKIQALTQFKGLNTSFNTFFFKDQTQYFSQGIGKAEVKWLYSENDFKLKIGAGISYLLGDESLNSNLNYYPKLEIFYDKKGNSISPYLKANGGVYLSSYRESALKNSYLAPITDLRPYFNRYNASLGIRSSLSSVLNFDFGLLLDQIENFQYYQRLPRSFLGEQESFRLSNAYENKFTNVDLYGIRAQIRIDLARNNFVQFETSYRYYDLVEDQVLLNIPALEMNWKSQFRFRNILTLYFNGEVWGDRTAIEYIRSLDFIGSNIGPEKFTLPFFLRSTAHLTIKLNDQFDAFIKGRFSNSDIHGQWGFYQEPSLILLGGITYKFDFQY